MQNMRLDKFLKVSRIIKRRTVANEAADGGRISVNGRVVKPSYEVKVGDIVEIKFGDKTSKFKIVAIPTVQGKNMPQILVRQQCFLIHGVSVVYSHFPGLVNDTNIDPGDLLVSEQIAVPSFSPEDNRCSAKAERWYWHRPAPEYRLPDFRPGR